MCASKIYHLLWSTIMCVGPVIRNFFTLLIVIGFLFKKLVNQSSQTAITVYRNDTSV